MKPQFRLIDGPIVKIYEHRSLTIERMALDLVKYDAAVNEQDAVRCLMAKGYSPFDVMVLLPQVRQVAFQHIVAAEMVKP